MPDPYARAFLADIDGRILGRAVVTVLGEDNTTVVRKDGKRRRSSRRWRSGRAYAVSTVSTSGSTSTAAVTLDDVSLFGGLVTAASVELLAERERHAHGARGGTQGSQVRGFAVDGKAGRARATCR